MVYPRWTNAASSVRLLIPIPISSDENRASSLMVVRVVTGGRRRIGRQRGERRGRGRRQRAAGQARAARGGRGRGPGGAPGTQAIMRHHLATSWPLTGRGLAADWLLTGGRLSTDWPLSRRRRAAILLCDLLVCHFDAIEFDKIRISF